MKNKISFVELIKNEILEFNWDTKQLDILFFSFLKTGGIFNSNKFVIGLSLSEKKDFIISLFEKYYGIKPETKELATKVNYIIKDDSFVEMFNKKDYEMKLDDNNESMAFIAGAFVARGWISKPTSRFYHLEIRVGQMEQSLNLQEAIDSLGIESKTHIKDKWFITYIKKSMMISDLLRAMHAQDSMMIFEEERISRDFATTFSKMETIEAYNSTKIDNASRIQIEAIQKLMDSSTWKIMKTELKNIAEIRLNNPTFSLSDIQFIYSSNYGKEVSKATVNNWLRKIVDLSKTI